MRYAPVCHAGAPPRSFAALARLDLVRSRLLSLRSLLCAASMVSACATARPVPSPTLVGLVPVRDSVSACDGLDARFVDGVLDAVSACRRAVRAVRTSDVRALVALVDTHTTLSVTRSPGAGSAISTEALDRGALDETIRRAGGLHRFLWIDRDDGAPAISIVHRDEDASVFLVVAGDPARGATLRFARTGDGWRWQSVLTRSP